MSKTITPKATTNELEVKVERLILKHKTINVHAFAFLPTEKCIEKKKNVFAIFTHGYTSHKGDLVNWGSRLAHFGIPTLVFDLPGHHLGHYYEVESLEFFKEETPNLFIKAYDYLKAQNSDIDNPKLILGGHSLGAYFALNAMKLSEFASLEKLAILVGFGLTINQKGEHLLTSNFYRKTLDIRKQLISEHLDPDIVFPWIQKEKENLKLSDSDLYIITGANDAVVGANGGDYIAELLRKQGNRVELIKPNHLPHHEPELAAPHIMSLLKKIL